MANRCPRSRRWRKDPGSWTSAGLDSYPDLKVMEQVGKGYYAAGIPAILRKQGGGVDAELLLPAEEMNGASFMVTYSSLHQPKPTGSAAQVLRHHREWVVRHYVWPRPHLPRLDLGGLLRKCPQCRQLATNWVRNPDMGRDWNCAGDAPGSSKRSVG